MRFSTLLLLLTVFFILPVFSQDLTASQDGDSMRTINLGQVEVISKKFNSTEDRIAFAKLKHNTLKVYPYAQMAVKIYEEMEESVSDMNRKREKKKYVNAKEKELRERFEKEIRDLTRTQGSILIKLINRNTRNSCYDIVKEMKGGFTAFFWNVGGKFYDHDLKAEYKPEENADLELIIRMIDNGQLQVKSLQ